MDSRRFDDLTKLFGVSLTRHRFIALAGGLLGGSLLVSDAQFVDARNRGKHRKRGKRHRGAGGDGTTAQDFCFGTCTTSGDCPADRPNCVCASPPCSEQNPARCCIESECGQPCTSDAQCVAAGCPGGVCFDSFCAIPCPNLSCRVAADCPCSNGGCQDNGTCACYAGTCDVTCSGFCEEDSDCPGLAGCICDESTLTCVTLLCGGRCAKDSDCQPLSGCGCDVVNGTINGQGVQFGQCVTQTCGGNCSTSADCSTTGGCICHEGEECVTVSCPGFCTANEACTARGQDDCVCFLGVNTADSAAVDRVVTEGQGGRCGTCQGTGDPCAATTECCGQLVCLVSGAGAAGPAATGTCQQKPPGPKPHRRCKKHGQGCRADRDCCAQGVCYKGQCGEKDTHCNNDGECARGYRCRGGPLAPGHRRCRKNGRRRRNKTHRRNG